jgi:hypothetical protein
MRYSTPEDIVNRGLQHLGAIRITTLSDNSKNAAEAAFIYDKCRRAEMRANPWNFLGRRQVLRPIVAGTSEFFAAAPWVAGTPYPPGSVVSYNGINWVNNLATTISATPGTSATPQAGWVEFNAPAFLNPLVFGTTYYPGELVGQGSLVYITPLVTAATPPALPWIATTIPPLTLLNVPFYFPQGLTTNALGAPKNVYPLPVGYLRIMPQDPKSASTPAQTTTAGTQNLDFEFEAGFIYTAQKPPFVFRFAADLQNVLWFDDMFCEVLAARIAVELAETITQSPAKMQAVQTLYNDAIEKAIRVNAIEAGSTEPDTDKVASNRGPTREKAPPQPRQQQQ